MALSVEMRRARAQKALEDAGYDGSEAAEAEVEDAEVRKPRKPKPASWPKAKDSTMTTGSN